MNGYGFPCPACSEWLEFKRKYSPVIGTTSAVLAMELTWHLGYHETDFVFISLGTWALLYWTGAFLKGFFGLNQLQRIKGTPFEHKLSLDLTTAPDEKERHGPSQSGDRVAPPPQSR